MVGSAILGRIREAAVVPIVRTARAETAIQAVEALHEAGLTCIEITMTVQNALKAMERIADRYGDEILLGAGTVLDPETARACILAGVQFLVTPSMNANTIEIARRYNKPIFPGALTPTEVLNAWEAGGDGVKVFPCSAVGGAKYIRALKAPFPQIEMFPTGGVNLETIADFFAAGSMAVGVGSELVDEASVRAGQYDLITCRGRKFLEAAATARAALNT